jgi:hypothetical protein
MAPAHASPSGSRGGFVGDAEPEVMQAFMVIATVIGRPRGRGCIAVADAAEQLQISERPESTAL